MRWHLVKSTYKPARELADRHYSRQSPRDPKFMPPGQRIVLYLPGAVWGTSWQKYQQHEFSPAFVCTIFRNESEHLSSDLIREACAITAWKWPLPENGIITFVDESKVKSENPGYCFKKAGFVSAGYSKTRKLKILHLAKENFPEPLEPLPLPIPLDFSGKIA